MAGVTLDTGALIAADRDDPIFWTWWKRKLAQSIVLSVPTPVVAQAWRGAHSARIGQILKCCREMPMTAECSKAVGEICGKSGTSDVVDAFVVWSASRRGDDVLTGDPEDLSALAGHIEGLGRIKTMSDLRKAD